MRWLLDVSDTNALKMKDFDTQLVARLEEMYDEVGIGAEIKYTRGSAEYRIFYDRTHKDGAIWKQVRCDDPSRWRYVERRVPKQKKQRTAPAAEPSDAATPGTCHRDESDEDGEEPSGEVATARPSCGLARAFMSRRESGESTGDDERGDEEERDPDSNVDAEAQMDADEARRREDEDEQVEAEADEAEVDAYPDSDETREM